MGKEQELLDAARAGNVAAIEKILSGQRKWTAGPLALPLPNIPTIRKGVHPNCQDSSGGTPLHHASLNGHKDVIELLLKLQASANIPDQKGCYPLHLSAWRGNVDICRVLLLHGPSVAKVNAQNLEGETALHSAAQYGHKDVVDLLLQNCADPEIKNHKGERPLELAIQYGRLETVQLLLNNYQNKSHEIGPDDKPLLHLAAKNGHKPVLQLLLDTGFSINHRSSTGTVLHEACMYSRLEIVKLLLEKGIDVDIKDNEGKTATDLLKDLNTPKSLEILKAIDVHINGGGIASENDQLSTELDYDFPVPHILREGSKERLDSEDSLASEGSGTALEPEESIYDHPKSFQAILGKKPSVKTDLPLKSQDTPKKPPRKRLPQSVLLKSGVVLDKPENTHSLSSSSTTTATTTADRNNVEASNPKQTENQVSSCSQVTTSVKSEADCSSGLSRTAMTCVAEEISNDSREPKNPANVTYRSPLNTRLSPLNLNGSRPLSCREFPLRPLNNRQPSTPEHPPPSPTTALLGIREKLLPKERRHSDDMKTVGETDYHASVMTHSTAVHSGDDDGVVVPVSGSRISSEGCSETAIASFMQSSLSDN